MRTRQDNPATPVLLRESPQRLSLIIFQSSSIEFFNKYVNIYIGKRPQEVVTLEVFLNSLNKFGENLN